MYVNMMAACNVFMMHIMRVNKSCCDKTYLFMRFSLCIFFPLITTCFGLSQVAFGGDGAAATDAFSLYLSLSILLLVFVDLMRILAGYLFALLNY